MSEPASFSGFPTEIMVRNCHYIVPGIERCDGIYFHPTHQKLQLIIARKNDNGINFEEVDLEPSEQINSLRNSRFGTVWLTKEEVPHLPFNQKITNDSGIESELEKVVLLIKIQNKSDFLMDLIFLYDISNLSLFGLSTNENLSASHKDITAKLIFNSFKMLNVNYKHVNKSRTILNDALIENSRKLAGLRKSNLDIQTANQERILEYCRFRLNIVSHKYNKHFYFADCAIDQILQFTGKIQLLDEVIAGAVALANEFDNLGKDIKIIESYLNFSISRPEIEQVNRISENEFAVEIEYLDKLEAAAIKTLQQGKKLIGNHLIQNYEKKISFAAISGFISKHIDNIIKLLRKYPKRWPTLSNQFMPIKKFVDQINLSEQTPAPDDDLLDKTG